MLRLVSFVMLGAATTGCGSGEAPPPAPIPEPVQRAFEASCMHEGCHTAAARAGGLSLDVADSPGIVGGASAQSELPLVVVGDLSGSYMAIKLLPDDQLPAGAVRHQERMPPDGVESEDVEPINTILSWIAGFEPGGTGGGSGPSGSTAADGSGGSESGSSTSTTEGTETAESTGSGPTTNSGGGTTNPACSVEEVTEGAVAGPLDKGDGVGQIPQPVGVVLEERCGCHTLADRELNTKFPALRPVAGTLFLDHGDTLSLGAQLEDTIFGTMSMPPGSCPAIPADDLAVLDQWFSDGQPDGATFEPP